MVSLYRMMSQKGGYVAFNPETGTTTQGETVEESLANLREGTELYTTTGYRVNIYFVVKLW